MATLWEAAGHEVARAVEIVRGLPDYFTSGVPEKVAADFVRGRSFVVGDGDDVAGFAVVEQRLPHCAEILWAAVEPERRGARLGTLLVEHVLGRLRADGVRLVEVKTLDESAGYEPYEASVAFWLGRGFLKIDVIDPLPGWPEGNPCAISVAVPAG